MPERDDTINGLLYSQIGYEPAIPLRVAVRSSDRSHLGDEAQCSLFCQNVLERSVELNYWGEIWGSHWWIAEFPANMKEAEYHVKVTDNENTVHEGDSLRIKSDILWESTVFPMSVEMLETRARMAQCERGWMDAGMMWQESNAHSSMILGLLDVLEKGFRFLSADNIGRIQLQVINGCDYLVLTQEKAADLGHARGALSHDLLGHKNEILPNDAFKAVVAWRRACQLLPDTFKNEKERYESAANTTMRWLKNIAQPLGDKGLCRRQRGLAEDTPIPTNEWTTRDLVMRCWGELETYKCGKAAAKASCIETAQAIISRQITEAEAESGFYGHFREYDSTDWSEKSWTHSIFGGQFGVDAGGTFPNYLLPLIEMMKLWPNDADAPRWRETLECFANGYLIPACRKNPFLIVPQGIFGEEGPLWFTGTFHGMNCIYGLTAALALELADLLDISELITIAYANLQWVAGLNAGLTTESIKNGCHAYRRDIPPNEALPVSMIHGIGHHTAGTWFGTRGVICNGFATGDQFQFDVIPTRESDGPRSFTDEDWIPHSAAWLSGCTRLMNTLHSQ